MTQQLWRACVRRILRCKLACVLPPSSLDPRQDPGAFAVAKDENRDKFIGDRRSLNSRERSVGPAHLPCSSPLRRMILERSETLQITFRDTKTFYLYEVPPSRVTKQVIGPRSPSGWLELMDDENWDVVAADESECWVWKDRLKTCTSIEPVSESVSCRIGMTAIVMGDVNAGRTLESPHRRQLLAARALNERSLLIRGLSFPRTKTYVHIYIYLSTILSSSASCNFRTCISRRCFV